MKNRIHAFDNVRLFLIVCIVAGHLLEIAGGELGQWGRGFAYFLLYSFHIPALIFLNGLFAKGSLRRCFWIFALYIVFQTVYILFARQLGYQLQLQYAKPYWLLWYLLTWLYYSAATLVFDRLPGWMLWAVLPLSIAAALYAGTREDVGYVYSLSRSIVFAPFYVLGLCVRRNRDAFVGFLRKIRWAWVLLLPLAWMLTVYLYHNGINKYMLYGSYGYSIGYTALQRLAILICAAVWIAGLLTMFLHLGNRRIPVLSTMGAHTLPVYLLHGFVVRYLGATQMLPDLWHEIIVLLAGIALLANPWTDYVITTFWMEIGNDKRRNLNEYERNRRDSAPSAPRSQ